MLIDWFTVCAQALNFVVLVWLMKRFLYKPILNAIDVREKGIAAKLADAAAKEATAKKEQEDFRHKNEELDQQRAALLAKTTEDAKSEGQRLLGEARKAADDLSAKRREALQREAHDLDKLVRGRAQEEVFAIARKALSDLATTSLEERMGAVFTHRLGQMDARTKEKLGQALRQPGVVRSAFELPAAQRAVIQNALNETFSADVHVTFETAPELISGIELTTSGQKVAWTIDGYLASMEKHVAECVEAQDKPAPKPKPQTNGDAKPKPKPAPAPEAKSP